MLEADDEIERLCLLEDALVARSEEARAEVAERVLALMLETVAATSQRSSRAVGPNRRPLVPTAGFPA